MSTTQEQDGPKFDVEVQLTGTDGNAFSIIGNVTRALKKAGASAEQVKEFSDQAMSGDYNNVLQTAMRWVRVV